MKIIYYVHDLHFPLREGIRKQAWWLAQAMLKEGHQVEIISTAPVNKKIIREGIPITYTKPWRIRSARKMRADVVHYLIHPTPMIIPFLLFSKAKAQYLTIHDGALNLFWKRIWWPFLKPIINKKINKITIQTDYQQILLKKASLHVPSVKIAPLIPNQKKVKNKRNKVPTLLFMSHLHPSKGIYEVLKAFQSVRKEVPNLRLVIADSGITKNRPVYQYLKKVNPGNIILKKVVVPEEELSKAWIYLYPLNSARETFSVPLSLIEAIHTKTPYISTNVGGIPEYFDAQALVPPQKPGLLAEKILHLLQKPTVCPLKKQINNGEVLARHLQLYSFD
ncbi:MAG: glycosyltransferase family 4 protein [Nanoarchaeota archaeon]